MVELSPERPGARFIRTFRCDGKPAEQWEMLGCDVNIFFNGGIICWTFARGNVGNECWNMIRGSKQQKREYVYDSLKYLLHPSPPTDVKP